MKENLEPSRTPPVASTAASIASLRAPIHPQAQTQEGTSQSPAVQPPLQQTHLHSAAIEERLQQLAHGVNPLTTSGMMPTSLVPPAYTSAQSEDGN